MAQHSRKQLLVAYKTKQTVTPQSSNLTSKFLFEKQKHVHKQTCMWLFTETVFIKAKMSEKPK